MHCDVQNVRRSSEADDILKVDIMNPAFGRPVSYCPRLRLISTLQALPSFIPSRESLHISLVQLGHDFSKIVNESQTCAGVMTSVNMCGGSSAVILQEDEEGFAGVKIGKELMKVAGKALEINISSLGPKVLPLSEKLCFAANFVARKVSCCLHCWPLHMIKLCVERSACPLSTTCLDEGCGPLE